MTCCKCTVQRWMNNEGSLNISACMDLLIDEFEKNKSISQAALMRAVEKVHDAQLPRYHMAYG